MSSFGNGSSLVSSLQQEGGLPLDTFAVAQNVAEVLAYDNGIRYIGMSVFCIDEAKKYVFKRGILDSDFVPESDGEGFIVVDDYSALPTIETETIGYVKNDYVDTITSEEYKSGFYLYDVTLSKWIAISNNSNESYVDWQPNKDYYVGDRFKYNGDFYEVIIDYTSTSVFNDGIDNLIYVLEKYYVLSQQKYDLMVANGLINATNKHLYIVNDATSNTIKLNLTITQNVQRVITSNNGTDYNINADLIVEQIGEETITISKSLDNITLDDGTEIHVGDVLEIYKVIGGVEVYSYCIVIEPIYNPFI